MIGTLGATGFRRGAGEYLREQDANGCVIAYNPWRNAGLILFMRTTGYGDYRSGRAMGRSRNKAHEFRWLTCSGNGPSSLWLGRAHRSCVRCESTHTISTSSMSKVKSPPARGWLTSIVVDCSGTSQTVRYVDRSSASMACDFCPALGCRSAACVS